MRRLRLGWPRGLDLNLHLWAQTLHCVCVRSPCRPRVAMGASWRVGCWGSSSPFNFFPVNADLVYFFAQRSLKTVTWCGSRACGPPPSPATWPPSTSRKEASWLWRGPGLPWTGHLVSLCFPVCEMGTLTLSCSLGCWALPWEGEYQSPLPSRAVCSWVDLASF